MVSYGNPSLGDKHCSSYRWYINIKVNKMKFPVLFVTSIFHLYKIKNFINTWMHYEFSFFLFFKYVIFLCLECYSTHISGSVSSEKTSLSLQIKLSVLLGTPGTSILLCQNIYQTLIYLIVSLLPVTFSLLREQSTLSYHCNLWPYKNTWHIMYFK